MRGRYEFDNDYMVARNMQNGRVIHIGDSMRVLLAEANTLLRQIEFYPADEKRSGKSNQHKSRRNVKVSRITNKSKKKQTSKKKAPRKGKRR